MYKKLSPLVYSLLVILLFVTGCTAAVQPTQAPQVQPTVQPTVPPNAPAPTQPPAATQAPASGEKKLILATTTSTQDSGLLDYLLPDFEKQFGAKIDVIAVGSGQALKLGEDGNADVLLVHSPAAEADFMKAGHGTRREDVMYNDFVIVGPASDPAGIKGTTSAVEAFKKIADSQSKFVSRGDNSGTNAKELSIWKKAAIEPKGDWYVSAGQGMGEVLSMADEQQAYTLSDRATYLARTKQGLTAELLVEGDKDLFNPYGVIAVDPQKNPNIHADLATQFIDWIISVPVQEKISQFGVADFGQTLFTPSSAPWKAAHGG